MSLLFKRLQHICNYPLIAISLSILLSSCATTPTPTPSSTPNIPTPSPAASPGTPTSAPILTTSPSSTSSTTPSPSTTTIPTELRVTPTKIALALGGGAARGFAHIGVIKALEANGIIPDIVVGTSAGSLVGALYANGYNPFELQRIGMQIDETALTDWAIPDRGFIKGEALRNFVNQYVQNRPLEKLKKPFATVATDLQSGEQVVFRTGNTGTAVRASSSVPGVFQPVMINGHEYVDGGLVSPVPVRAARSMGADIVIAVYISSDPRNARVKDTIGIMLQTFSIMGQRIATQEMTEADIIIRPDLSRVRSTTFDDRNLAILEGEKVGIAAIATIRQKIAERNQRNQTPVPR